MRQCTTCGRTYPNEVDECEYDGSPLFHIGDSSDDEASDSPSQLPESNPFSNESGIPPALRASAQFGAVPSAVTSDNPPAQPTPQTDLRGSASFGAVPSSLRGSASFGAVPATDAPPAEPQAPTSEPLRASGMRPLSGSVGGSVPGAAAPPTFRASTAGGVPPATPSTPAGARPPGTPPSRPPGRPPREPDTKSLLAGIDEEINNLKEPEPIAPLYEPAAPPTPMRSSEGFGAVPPVSQQPPSFGAPPSSQPSFGSTSSFDASFPSSPGGIARSPSGATPTNGIPTFNNQNFPPIKQKGSSNTLKTLVIILVVLAVLIVIGLVVYLFVLK